MNLPDRNAPGLPRHNGLRLREHGYTLLAVLFLTAMLSGAAALHAQSTGLWLARERKVDQAFYRRQLERAIEDFERANAGRKPQDVSELTVAAHTGSKGPFLRPSALAALRRMSGCRTQGPCAQLTLTSRQVAADSLVAPSRLQIPVTPVKP